MWNKTTEKSPPKDGTFFICAHQHYTVWVYTQIKFGTYHPNAKGKPCFRDTVGNKVGDFSYWMEMIPPPTTHNSGQEVNDAL
jgi:hypothetical protein